MTTTSRPAGGAPAAGDADDTDHPDGEPGVRTRVWHAGKVIDENYPLARVSDKLEHRDLLVWVDLADPDHHMLERLAEELSLDPNAVEDAVGRDERPKATHYDGYTFVTAYATRFDPDDDEVVEARISAFVLDHALVTVHGAHFTQIDEVVKRWDGLTSLIEQNGVDALLYGLLDWIVDEQFDTIQDLDDEIDTLEDGLFDDKPQSRQQSARQFVLRRSVVEFRRYAAPMTQVVASLHRFRGPEHRAMDSYWADLDDHVARVVDWTDTARELLANVFGANMALQDARLNNVMKKLTAWAAIIAVPTAITGFYGQNIPYPGFGVHWGFIVSSAVIVVAMIVLYVSFKRRNWL